MIGVSILGGALFLYALLSYIRPLRLRWWWKVLLSLPLAAVAFKFQLLYWVWGGHLFRPQVPMWLELGSNWLFMALLLFVPLLVALDALRLPLWCLLRRRPGWKRVNNVLNSLLMLASLVTTAVGMHHAFALPEVREITLRLPQLREPVRLAMLTDLHADRYKQAEFFREVVTRTNALQADAVVITGDFEDGHLYSLAPALAPLRHLESRWGVYAVDGNHDYFSGHDAWQRYLKKLGIRFLNNEHVLPGPGHLVLAGVTDPAAARDNCPPPDLAQALAGAPAGLPVVLLAHQPRMAAEAARRGVALQLSGHTHGGHAPGLREIIARFNGGLAQGLHRIGHTQVYVSNGTSLWSGFPLRLFTPAEITLITLLPEGKSDSRVSQSLKKVLDKLEFVE